MSDLMQKIISLAKRRGFVFPSSEIYGGFSSSYDFGPLGALLKKNIKDQWLQTMLNRQEDIVLLDSAILMSPKVWQASGHLTAGFADELVECKKCHKRYRLDEIKGKKCPECGGEFTQPKQFNLMMKTFVGSTEDEKASAYLRAETCQGIYVNFKNVLNSMRLKLPFGIAQVGKSFRNEITTKNFIFRMREFEQMEMQWFCDPKEADKWFNFWKQERLNWYFDLGVNRKKLRLREVPKKERAHYARQQVDLEYQFPFGWQEIEGIHNRGDWDLGQHQKHSKENLSYEGFVPFVIETSVGVERSLLAFLTDSYKEIEGGRTETTKVTKKQEVMLAFDKRLAPIKIAVFPLLKNKPELVKKAKQVYQTLVPYFIVQYDESGAIGRRYRRQDEIGTPFCVTIDFDSLDNDDVTVRDRDTMKQKRVKVAKLIDYFKEKLCF